MAKNRADYSKLFDRYVANGDGKYVVAEELAGLAQRLGRPRVLDIGAGSGEIAARLIQESSYLHAIEPSSRFTKRLELLQGPTVDVSRTSIQDFDGSGAPYDLIVLSYVLESIDPSEWKIIFEKLTRLLSERGMIVAVTFLDGCGWDCFATAVEACIGDTGALQGGLSRVAAGARSAGFNARVIGQVETRIWGSNPEDLYHVLEFFFRDAALQYEKARSRLLPELLRFSERSGPRTCLPVQEVLLEVLPLPCTVTGPRALLRDSATARTLE